MLEKSVFFYTVISVSLVGTAQMEMDETSSDVSALSDIDG